MTHFSQWETKEHQVPFTNFNQDQFLADHGLNHEDHILYWRLYWIAERSRKAAGVSSFLGHYDLFAWWIGNVADPEHIQQFNEMQSRIEFRLSQKREM